MNRPTLWIRLALVVTSAACGSASARAQDPGTIKLDSTVDFMPNGDAKATMVLDVAEDAYGRLKRTIVNPQKFLSNFSSGRSDFEVSPSSRATYDDPQSAVKIDLLQLGAIRNGGNGKWDFAVEKEYEYVNQMPVDGRTVFFFYGTGELNGMPVRGQARFRLPEGATSPEWDAANYRIRYRLARDEGKGAPEMDVSMQTKPRIMSALYKVYGLGTPELNAQWAGKAVLKNSGDCVVKDIRTRWKFGGYSEWSGWSKFPEMVPGQTGVSVYYPTLDGRIAQLTTNTPIDVTLEWQYEDASGKQHSDTETARVIVLGRHDFLFYTAERGADTTSYAEQTPESPLVAAFVSRDDPVVKQFAAMANKIAGGVGSTQSEETLLACMQAIYELEIRNDFSYQYPAGLADKSVSFDERLVQHIKFPRDVIRDKSGTCIDLAICYAAVANAIGMDVSLALIPGHCFPIVRWNGRYYPIEATCVRGGVRAADSVRNAPSSFEEAMKIGSKELTDSMNSGQIVIVDVQEWWTRGVSGPELESLPANILTEWGISVEGVAGAARPIAGQPQVPGQPQTQAPASADGFIGVWTGSVPDGAGGSMAVTLTIEKAPQAGYTGKSVVRAKGQDRRDYDIIKTYIGEVANNSMNMVCQQMLITDVATGTSQQGYPDGRVTAQLKDGKLVGQSASDQGGGTIEFSFERKTK